MHRDALLPCPAPDASPSLWREWHLIVERLHRLQHPRAWERQRRLHQHRGGHGGGGGGGEGEEEECVDCGSRGCIVLVGCDVTCTRCGLVQRTDRISERAEWRSFSDPMGGKDDSGNRCGNAHQAPVASCVIDKADGAGGHRNHGQQQQQQQQPAALRIDNNNNNKNRASPPLSARRLQEVQRKAASDTTEGRRSRTLDSETSDMLERMDAMGVADRSLRAAARDMYVNARCSESGQGVLRQARPSSKHALMGACLYLASERSLDVARIMRAFDVDMQRTLNAKVHELTRAPPPPPSDGACVCIDNDDGDPLPLPRWATTPTTAPATTSDAGGGGGGGGGGNANDDNNTADNANEEATTRMSRNAIGGFAKIASVIVDWALLPSSSSSSSSSAAEGGGEEDRRQGGEESGAATSAAKRRRRNEDAARSPPPPPPPSFPSYASKALHARALKARLKFLCGDMKRHLLQGGHQRSLNPVMFDVGIAIVACERMGIPLSPGLAALLFVERGTEATLARNARIVRQAVPPTPSTTQ